MADELIDTDEVIDSSEVVDGTPDGGEDKKTINLSSLEKIVDRDQTKDDDSPKYNYEPDEVVSSIKNPKELQKELGDALNLAKGDAELMDLFDKVKETRIRNEQIKLAEDQGWFGELGSALVQSIVGEIVGGTIEGIGYLTDIKSMWDGSLGEGNTLSDIGVALKDWTREVAPIHVDPRSEESGKFRPWDSEWWFSNLPSVASSVSIMIPVAGWARGASLIGKGLSGAARTARAARAAKKAKALGGLNKIDDVVRETSGFRKTYDKIFKNATAKRVGNAVHQGIVSRHIESNMEASGTYKQEYEKVLAETGDEELARRAASDAAAFSYYANSVMVLQDIPQYFLLGRGMKANRAFNKYAQMKAAGMATTKAASKAAYRQSVDMLSEFGEEAYQFIIGEEAMHYADVRAGIAEDSNFSSRFGEYVSDGELWTSGFFGAIGAGVMQGVKPVFDKITGKTKTDSRVKELEERGAKFAYHSKKLRAAAESGLPDVYEQAMLDASTEMAVTAAREGNIDHYVKQLENLKTADAETKEKMGVDETFSENIDRLVSDAKAIKEIWNKNESKFDPSILPQVVQSKFIISKLDNDRGKLIEQINKDRNDIHRYNELSADGRNVFDAKLKIKSAERGVEHAKKILADKSRKLTKEQKERIEEFINQQEAIIATGKAEVSAIESDDNITLPDSDKQILKLLNNDAIIGEAVSNMEKLAWQDQLIDAHIARLNKLSDREIINQAAEYKANLEEGREDFRRVQELYSQIYKGAKEEILGKRKTIGVDEEGNPIKEESEDWENAEGLTQRYEVELTPKEKQAAIDEAKEILARTTDEKDRENIAKMIEEMETVVRDGISRFQRQEARKAKALQELENKRLDKIKRLNAAAKGRITKEIATEVALAYDQYAMIDHAYDDTPLGELFFKNTDVLPVFHNGERGILYKSDDTAELVFQSSSSGEEFIVSGSLEDTVSNLNLGVLKDSYFPVDFVINGKKKLVKDEETGEIIASISTAENYTSFGLSGDNASIWIGDSELSHIGTMPQESLNYDEAGNLKSVTLINGKGEEVEITGEILMYEVADMLLVYQLAIEQFLGKDQTFTSGGKEYQVDFNATNPMQSKVFEVLRDEKGEILMTEEVLPGKRNIYNKDGSHNKKGRILNEITGQFREQLAKDIVGYTEGDVEFAPRIQRERETVREYIERGEGPLAKRKGETKEEYALRTGDTRGISVKNRENEIVKLQKRLEDPNISEAERTATLEKISQERQQQKEDEQRKAELAEKSRYAIKGTNKWILKEQNEEVTDTEDVPTEPPGGPTDKKKPDETKPKRESTKNPKTEEEITDQFTDPDISDAELQTKAISKVFEDIEPSASKLTEELKDAQSIEDLEGLLNEKQQELAGSANVLKEGVAEDGSITIPDEVRGTVETVAVVEGDEINTFETVTPMEGATESSLNAEERDQLEADIIRIKDFISKVKTEFATIKDEAIRAQLETEEKAKSAVFTSTTDAPPSTLEVEDTQEKRDVAQEEINNLTRTRTKDNAEEVDRKVRELEAKEYKRRLDLVQNKISNLVDEGFLYSNEILAATNERPIILVNVAPGIVVPFYQSTQGTSGKDKDQWYPVFGLVPGWLVKSDDSVGGGGYGYKAIQKAQARLAKEFPLNNHILRAISPAVTNHWRKGLANVSKGLPPFTEQVDQIVTNIIPNLHFNTEERIAEILDYDAKEFKRLYKEAFKEDIDNPKEVYDYATEGLFSKLDNLERGQPEPSFELESTEPAEDSRRSRSTQQNTDRVDGSIGTKTYQHRKRKTEGGQVVLDFDSNGNPIVEEGLGIELNTDLLANPNLIKEGGKLYLQPLENDWFRKGFIENENKGEPNYYMNIPIMVYLEDENGEKQPVGILKADTKGNLTEEERVIRKAIYDLWKNNNKNGYTVGNLTINDNGTLVGFNRGPNLRTVKDENNKSVRRPIADRWKAMYQYDDSGNIVLRKNEDIEFKFGYVTRPKEAAPTLNVPAADVLLETAAKNTKVDSGQAGQIYGFVLNGNGDYVPVKLSTSNIDLNAQETITGLLTSEKFTEKDLKRIQEIIYVQYSNDELIEKMDLLISTDEKTKTIDPVIQILLNTKTNQPYVQFIHNKKIYSLNISELNKERPNIARKKIEGPVGNQKITVDDSVTIDQILANDFNGISPLAIISKIIANKKYNVQGDKLNTKAGTQYTSPITNKEYNTYNDYLIGRPDINGNENTEFAGGSILQTDVQPSDGGNYFYDSQLQIEIGEQRFQEEDSKVEKEVAEKEEIDEDKDDFDMFPDVQASTDPLGTIGGIPSMSPLGRFNMFLNKFNIQLSGFSSMKPGKVSQITQQFKNEAKVFGLEGRVSTNGSLYLYDPSAKKALVKNNSPSNNPNFKLKLSRVKPIKTDYPYQTTRTRTGRTIFQLGITPIQWATLPRKEKENIINCN